MSTPSPVQLPELYDTMTISGATVPGIVKLDGFERAQKWDVKDGDGQDGASTTLKGDEIAKGTITIQLWDDTAEGGTDYFAAYDAFRPVFLRSVGNKSKGLDVYHPDLARLGVQSICIESEGQLVHDGKGGATVKLKVLEFKPPKPKPAQTPQGVAGKAALAGLQNINPDGTITTTYRANQRPDPDQDLIDKLKVAKNYGKMNAAARGGDSVFYPDGNPKDTYAPGAQDRHLGGQAVKEP